MTHKGIVCFFLIALFSLISIQDSFSQRRSTRSDRSNSRDRDRNVEQVSLMDKLAFDIQVGNFALGNGFFASAKVAAGYKILDPLTLGLGLKGEYGVQNQVGQNSDFSNYGLYGYARYRLGDQFYLKGEYNYFNSQCIAGLCSDNIDREKAWFPMLGGGYFSGFGKWKFGAEVLIALGGNSDPGGFQADDIYTILEYTFTFLYNL